MSRIGKKPIAIPDSVNLSVNGKEVSVKGPKGELKYTVSPQIGIHLEGNVLTFTRESDIKEIRALHGLTRALVNNMIIGVISGFTKTLEITGVGWKVQMSKNRPLLKVNQTPYILFIPPDSITITVPTPTQIIISGINKQEVGQVAAKIRSYQKPEPYKGKGIRYSTEIIRRKVGKKTGAK